MPPINANVTNQQITANVGETQIDVSVSGGVGPTGTQGVAASVQVGTVTTGAPGSSASVVNVGSQSAAVLNFVLPAGATGAQGERGLQGERGEQGIQGIQGVAGVQGPAGATGPAGVAGPKGDKGDQGVAGPAGATGATGPAGSNATATTDASALVSGTLDAARLPGSVVLTTDARLSDARQPLTHTHTASQISDFTAAVIAAAPPTVDASLLTQGTLPDARLSSNIARTADVSSAVAAVVNAAPATLDTLAELASALGSDANFSTTVTNSLAAKAPLANPTFTGTVSGITAAMVGLGNVANVDSRARSSHTGTQAISTVSGLQTALDAKASLAGASFTGGADFGSDVGVDGVLDASAVVSASSIQGRTLFLTAIGGGSVPFSVNNAGQVVAGTWLASAIAVDRGGTGATTASAARTNLGLVIGTDVAAQSHTHSASAITDFASAVAAAAPAEVLDFQTTAQFPATGLASKIYVATDHSRAYQWTGSQYAEIGPAGAFLPVHSHAASDITSGVLDAARLPLSTTAQALAGANAATVLTPQAMHLSRRGSGRAKFFELFTDFAINGSGFSAGTDGFLFQTDFLGAGSSGTTNGTTLSSFAGRVGAGLFTCSTGTASTGRSGFDSRETQTVFRFDAGTTTYETLVYLPTLADATDDYVFRIGFCQGNALSNDVMCFEYNRANSANWVGVTGFNGGYNRVTSGVAVAATKWILLRMAFTSASCEFFVNDVSIGTSSSSIRADGGCRIGCHLLKTAGTTSRSALVDFVYVRHDFNSDRTFT